MNPNECFFFQPTDYTSSATVCKWCGKEKYQHKSEQKQLIIDIMNDDAKDGLYKKQTAVEWLVEQLGKNGFISTYESIKRDELQSIIEQANQMFEEQIIDAVDYGPDYNRAEDYYNQEYSKL